MFLGFPCIFSCPKGSSIGDEVTGAAAGAAAAVLRKSREVQFRSFSRSGKIKVGQNKPREVKVVFHHLPKMEDNLQQPF